MVVEITTGVTYNDGDVLEYTIGINHKCIKVDKDIWEKVNRVLVEERKRSFNYDCNKM